MERKCASGCVRRHLPQNIGVGKGLEITKDGPSSQIDILLLTQLNHFFIKTAIEPIITPDLCMGVIEVKTVWTATKLREESKNFQTAVTMFTFKANHLWRFSFEHEGEDFQDTSKQHQNCRSRVPSACFALRLSWHIFVYAFLVGCSSNTMNDAKPIARTAHQKRVNKDVPRETQCKTRWMGDPAAAVLMLFKSV